jgi:glycerate kinase
MILLAPDKFKGTLTAAQVASTITEALRSRGVTDDIVTLPMADGGEGTAEALAAMPIADRRGCYILDKHSRLIVSAEIVGRDNFDMLKQSVIDRSSFDLGKAVKLMTQDEAVERVYIAVGGTATSDGGAGMLQALGAIFRDSNGEIITAPITPALLCSVTEIELPDYRFVNKIIGLIDVKAGLYDGAISALTFAPQKGATIEDMAIIERSLRKLSELTSHGRSSEYDGAGGGIGYALATALGAECQPGADFILQHASINWQDVSMVITGEGSIDRQTAAGKVVNAVCTAAQAHGVPFIAIGGRVADGINNPSYISTMLPGEGAPQSATEAAARLSRTILSLKTI